MATYVRVFLGFIAFVINTGCVLVEVYAEAEEKG